jgi:flagellar biosynthesis/type III secretory pathway protein FliH
MPSPGIHLRVDRELHAVLLDYAKRSRKTVSEAVRDRLRHGLSIVTEGYEAGYREGYTAAYAEAKQEFEQRAYETPSTPAQAKRKRDRQT